MTQQSDLVSIVVPVYNTAATLLETLDSIAVQTFPKENLEVIIVDDNSADGPTIKILNDLSKSTSYKDIPLKIVRHSVNRWLAETRNTGFKNSRGNYLIFLDSDDKIHRNYIKLLYLALASNELAGFAYPSIQTFGYRYEFIQARNFSAVDLFKENFVANASLVRRTAWESAGYQRKEEVLPGVNWFEDWDHWMRIVSKGFYGIPVVDAIMYYRTKPISMFTRSRKVLSMTNYLVRRKNIFLLPKFSTAEKNKNIEKLRSLGLNNIFSIYLYLIINKIWMKFFERPIFNFSLKQSLLSVISPKTYIKNSISRNKTLTEAEIFCGFKNKCNYNLSIKKFTNNSSKKILFAHYGWTIGGSEIVYTSWLKAASKIAGIKITELVFINEDNYLSREAKKYADECYSLNSIPDNPLSKMRYVWNLININQPNVIFNYANPFIYALSGKIKRHFPNIKIIDILHGESVSYPNPYEIADEYKEFLDTRIVTSTFWKEILVKKYNEREDKIVICNNSIDTKRFKPDKNRAKRIRELYGISMSKRVISYIGRISNDKQIETFINLIDLMKNNKHFYFIIKGKGNHENKLRRFANQDNVTLILTENEPENILAITDILVCPTKFEAFPMIGLEAASMNVPIIATKVPGFIEQINEGKFGFLYESNGPESDANQIAKIITSKYNELIKIGKNGRKYIESKHDYEKNAQIYRNLLNSML